VPSSSGGWWCWIFVVDCVGLLGFCGREEERGSEKEINKKINSVWLKCEKKKI